MTIQYSTTFKKQFQKLSPKLQERFARRLELFLIQSTHPQLRHHPLRGKFFGYWSLSVNGDLRAIYRKEGDDRLIFALIGSHSELYW